MKLQHYNYQDEIFFRAVLLIYSSTTISAVVTSQWHTSYSRWDIHNSRSTCTYLASQPSRLCGLYTELLCLMFWYLFKALYTVYNCLRLLGISGQSLICYKIAQHSACATKGIPPSFPDTSTESQCQDKKGNAKGLSNNGVTCCHITAP